jgi:hypothetical protein
MRQALEEKNVQFRTEYAPLFVDPLQKSIFYKARAHAARRAMAAERLRRAQNGEKLTFDILVAAFPTQPPQVLVDSGFTTPNKCAPPAPAGGSRH